MSQIKRPGILRQLHGSHVTMASEIPAGDVIIGCPPASFDNTAGLPYLFENDNTMEMGGLALRFCKDPSAAERALMDATPVGTVFSIGVDIKDWDGNTVYSVVAQGLPSEQIGDINMPAVIEIPECELSWMIAEITVIDPIGLSTLAVGYVTK